MCECRRANKHTNTQTKAQSEHFNVIRGTRDTAGHDKHLMSQTQSVNRRRGGHSPTEPDGVRRRQQQQQQKQHTAWTQRPCARFQSQLTYKNILFLLHGCETQAAVQGGKGK